MFKTVLLREEVSGNKLDNEIVDAFFSECWKENCEQNPKLKTRK